VTDAAQQAFATELGFLPCLVPLLVRNGLTNPDEARRFLFPRLRDLTDPFLIPGIRSAVDRIFGAIEQGQRIVLYGDYDVDGVTSIALLTRMLRAYGAEARPFLPMRVEEGYGLSAEGVERCLTTLGPQLLIALDCGTSSGTRIAALETSGVDVIVIDHHEVRDRPPRCAAFVNPKAGSDYHYLCTVGLVFKLCHALLKTRRLSDFDLKEYLDLVALGTVADLVPLIGENRILVQHGLRQMEKSRWIGLNALKRVAGVDSSIRPGHVGFRLGPRLNAAGRLGIAQDALDLLLTEDEDEATRLARSLDFQNRDRQAVEQRTLEEALAQVHATYDPTNHAAIVVGSSGWHPGVVGIVAARLMRQLHRPAIVIGFDPDGFGRGSGRSVAGFSLVEALAMCGEHLTEFGGHEMAAGVSLPIENLERFADAFRSVARGLLRPEQLQPSLSVDIEVTAEQIDRRLLHCHELLQPFGIGNPQPLFCLRGAVPAGEPRILKEKHRAFKLHQGGRILDAVYFNSSARPLPLAPWDVAFYLESNVYQNRVQLQLQVEAVRAGEQ
jgi:single-stranded-DNA-specific exonuclease